MSTCHERGQARVRWLPRPDGLEESVQFQPGYNCQRMDMQGHGVHGMEITWILRGPAGAVQLRFGTDWVPGELWPGHGISPDGSRGWRMASSGLWSTDPHGSGIGVHSHVPQYEDHEAEPICGLIGAPCYYDEALSAADPIVPLFMADGESAIWEALESRYAQLQEAVNADDVRRS